MAKEEQVDKVTMWRIVRKQLKMTPFKNVCLQLLPEAARLKWRERSKLLLDHHDSDLLGPIFFTDEKIFTVEAFHNFQNDHILVRSFKDIPTEVRGIFRKQKPASVMASAGVMTDGKKSPLIFMPEGVKINKNTYLDMLNDDMLPWLQENYQGTDFTFQQGSAPTHGAKITQQWCETAFPDFWVKFMWPLSSPNLNIMDYSM